MKISSILPAKITQSSGLGRQRGAGPHVRKKSKQGYEYGALECVLPTKERNVACWWSCGRARASLWDLVGAAISTPEVGLLTMWAAVGGAAFLAVRLPSENSDLRQYEG